MGILSPIFLCFFCQERLYNPRIYILSMYLEAYRDYSREDRYNPLLLIVEVWIGLGPLVFPFALGGFPHKSYGVWFIFPLHEFIYLLLLVAITYLILHKEIVEKIMVFVGILWIHPNRGLCFHPILDTRNRFLKLK